MIEAQVITIDHDARWCLAREDSGQTYLCPERNFQRLGAISFEDVVVGSRVVLTPIEGPKGMRGVDVRVLRL